MLVVSQDGNKTVPFGKYIFETCEITDLAELDAYGQELYKRGLWYIIIFTVDPYHSEVIAGYDSKEKAESQFKGLCYYFQKGEKIIRLNDNDELLSITKDFDSKDALRRILF